VPDPVVTAWLDVTYLAPTPLGVQLEMSAQIDREEGRKRFCSSLLYAGETLCACAEALLVRRAKRP